MSGTSRGQVTITLGRGGQVVKRDGSLADSLPVAGTKRSVRDRLGNNVDNALLHGSLQNSNKRQRGDIGMSSLNSNGFDDTRVGKDDLRFKLMQKNAFRRAQSDGDQRHGDLREKLSKAVQHSVTGLDSRQRPVTGLDSRQRPVTGLDSRQQPVTSLDSRQRPVTSLDSRQCPVTSLDSRQCPVTDLDSRQRLPQLKETSFLGRIPSTRSADDLPLIDSMRNSYSPWTLDHLRRRSPDRVLVTSRGLSPQRNADELQRRPLNRAYDDVRSVPYMSKDVVDATRPPSTAAFMSNSTLPPGSAMPVAPHLSQHPPLSSIVQKSSYMGDEQQTVDSLLHTLGLGKYAIIFKAEEIDMTALKQMGENDLKELGIPMGPRKKILLALLPRSKRPPSTNIR